MPLQLSSLVFKQKSITEILDSKKFTFSAEVFPPRNGKPADIILGKLDALSKMPIDFISVTKGAMGSMRGGTVPIGYMIPDRYKMNALVHFRCRDMNRREVENLLVDHMYFGTKNILAVLGDPLPGEIPKELDPATHNRYASDLVRQIADMNSGRYLSMELGGQSREGVRTDFCVGVACYPEAEDMDKEIMVMGEKVKAGARFAVTQMIFNADSYSAYVKELGNNKINIPIIPGIRPVATMAHVVAAEKNFGARVPDSLKKALQDCGEKEANKICQQSTVQLIKELRKAGAPGVHMFTLNDVKIIEDIVDKI
ncbi:MAG: methylenetetrahydrofolate reductase [Thermoplasmata archaeon]|nr:methylenetetrahydrofolate reductase [Thermoplasmata archaeon]